MQNITWDLYLVHWDEVEKLMYIHSSNTDGLHGDLADAVAGGTAKRVGGEEIFECFGGLNHLMLMNVGLTSAMSRAIRFTNYFGADVPRALSEAQLQDRIKSNLFGRGFEQGEKANIGCSQKGRIWSARAASGIGEWVEWCHEVGGKILDPAISVADILEHVITPEEVNARPPGLVPISIEWPETLLQRNEEHLCLRIGNEEVPFFEADIELIDRSADGSVYFRVFTERASVEYTMVFAKKGVEYHPRGNGDALLSAGPRGAPLSEWFLEEYPIIRFHNGSFLYDNQFCKVKRNIARFSAERINAWDWKKLVINIRKESQKVERRVDSIQYGVIRDLLASNHESSYDIVFDDDGEIADIVALKRADTQLLIHLFHCKYSKSSDAGARVKDLYEVCGQAQRSIAWRDDVEHLLDRLITRDVDRVKKRGATGTRFQRGDRRQVQMLKRLLPELEPHLEVTIVQPGLSRGEATISQLDLLGVTEFYLRSTRDAPLHVIGSE